MTFKSHLRCFSSLCGRAKKKGYLRVNPFDVDSISDWIRRQASLTPRRQWSRSPEDVRRVFVLARREALVGEWEEQRRYAYFATLFLLGSETGRNPAA